MLNIKTNAIENPGDPKYRQVKKENQRVKELLSGNQHGERLLSLVGFTLVEVNPESTSVKLAKADQFYRLGPGIDTNYLKCAKLELQGAHAEHMAAKEALKKSK